MADKRVVTWCLVLTLSLFVTLWSVNTAFFVAMAFHYPNADQLEAAERRVWMLLLVAAGGSMMSIWSVRSIWTRLVGRARALASNGGTKGKKATRAAKLVFVKSIACCLLAAGGVFVLAVGI